MLQTLNHGDAELRIFLLLNSTEADISGGPWELERKNKL